MVTESIVSATPADWHGFSDPERSVCRGGYRQWYPALVTRESRIMGGNLKDT